MTLANVRKPLMRVKGFLCLMHMQDGCLLYFRSKFALLNFDQGRGLWEQISLNFDVYGFKDGGWHPFQKNVNYEAFLVKRK